MRRKTLLFSLLLSVVCFSACKSAEKIPATTTTPAPAAAALIEPKDWSNTVLYFALVDRFADGDTSNNVAVDIHAKGAFHGGDLKGLLQHLNEISDLGVTALWITPVVKNIDGFVTGAGFPDYGYHGYWADDFYKIDPRFGTEQDLKALVDACHQRGMRVLLDVVYNHAGYNSHYLTDPRTKEWFRSEDRGTCGQDDLTSCVAGLPDFKTELPVVDDFLMKAHLGLAKRVGIDGFRLDTVKHVDHSFWKEHRGRTRDQLGKGFFLLGEVWGGDPQVLDPWFSGDEMDAGFDFSFQGNVLSFVLGRGRTVAFDHYLKSREKIRQGYLLSHFLSSHDVPGALFQLNGNKQLFKLAAVLQFTSVGIPMIYYGEEVGRPGGDWPDNRSDMPWGNRNIMPGAGAPRDEGLREAYRRLIEIRKAHSSLSRGIHSTISSEGDLLVFQQQDASTNDTVIVAINRGHTPANLLVTLPAEWGPSGIHDAWNNLDVERKGDTIELSVAAGEARILTKR